MENNWQPIETAPLDKSILLYRERIVVGGWHQDPPTANKTYIGSNLVHISEESGDSYWTGRGELYRFTPTHWMPLPEPPTGEDM